MIATATVDGDDEEQVQATKLTVLVSAQTEEQRWCPLRPQLEMEIGMETAIGIQIGTKTKSHCCDRRRRLRTYAKSP